MLYFYLVHLINKPSNRMLKNVTKTRLAKQWNQQFTPQWSGVHARSSLLAIHVNYHQLYWARTRHCHAHCSRMWCNASRKMSACWPLSTEWINWYQVGFLPFMTRYSRPGIVFHMVFEKVVGHVTFFGNRFSLVKNESVKNDSRSTVLHWMMFTIDFC